VEDLDDLPRFDHPRSCAFYPCQRIVALEHAALLGENTSLWREICDLRTRVEELKAALKNRERHCPWAVGHRR
jgi:hypothetical protein